MDIQTANEVIELVLLAIVFVISIGFHEYAHAYVSSILGDPTPKLQGRLTPNPIKHIDPIGFVMIFLIHFGWGKPVQVNPSYYKNPLKDELLVALAGPFSNILMAFVGSFLSVFIFKFQLGNPIIDNFFQLFIVINIALAIFNMMPIYPLDGYRIIKFLKPSWGIFMERNSFIFLGIFLLLVFMPGNFIGNFIFSVVTPVYVFFMTVSSFIIGF